MEKYVSYQGPLLRAVEALPQPQSGRERRNAERRMLPSPDDAFWHWANHFLNGNERRGASGRREEDRLH
ncbi:hypothetical protein IGB42_03909 [Andreprevotia sp. IGB-42]|uniref:hypothetical protein n=1 Tax=Andreprevotia sp. IGB-42 TaxID=2497473 RepID=UPI00135B7148|nr:hypothetical protein [Andreprevotia sp. IGB-42]KAF0811620.1 hypothetical protein IGB42_03909 [Andreprevotia sp. IGB-42]